MSLTTAQSVTAGVKKTFQANTTNAGLRLAGVAANPSGLVAGDLWYRSDTEKLSYRGASAARSLVAETLAQTLQNKTLGAVTLSGAVTGGDSTVDAVELGDYAEDLATDATFTGAETLDYTAGPYFAVTLTDNANITVSNPPASGSVGTFTVEVTQGSGPYSITWMSGTTWAGGTAPTLSAGSGDVDIFSFTTRDGGTTWSGFVGGFDFS